jgi:S1/P1 Nuclease
VFVLSADYKARARDVAEQQIALAGARLARLLNQALQ